ncbi:MAG: hypothetical protein QM756_36955 [Polyangiaceae bacterium]
MQSRSQQLVHVERELERQNCEWQGALSALAELDPSAHFLLKSGLLEELEAVFEGGARPAPSVPLPFALRA